MESNQQRQHQQLMGGNDGEQNDVGLPIGAMTDEQIEMLAKQIVAYATICEQLEEKYRALSSSSPGDACCGMLGNPYSVNPMAGGGMGYDIPRRHRWNPTTKQLQILESVFEEKNQIPPKGHVKEITAELAKHGPITEHNVYNWFQNRRARFRKKQVVESTAGHHEPEVQNVLDSSVRTAKPLSFHQNFSGFPSEANSHDGGD